MMEGYTFYTDEQVEKMGYKEVVGAVEDWSFDRNLNTAEPAKQLLKLYEEVGEIADAKFDNDSEELKDAFGDTLVVLTVLSTQLFEDNEEYSPVLEGLAFGGDSLLSTFEKEDLVLTLLKTLGEISSVIARNQGELTLEQKSNLNSSIILAVMTLSEFISAFDIEESLLSSYKYAYNVIKYRKGKLIDGVFVKESDLNE